LRRLPLTDVGDKCRICGAVLAIEVRAGPHGRLVRCDGCGTIFQDPRPSADELRAIYRSDDYFALGKRTGIGYADYVGDEAMYRGYFARKLARLGRWTRPGRMFEIGCAAGFSLDEARRAGWAVSGVEMSPAAAHYARDMLGLDVRVGGLEDLPPVEEAYDAVLALQTIEHLVDPTALLSWACTALRPGGLIVLTTPDVSSLPSKVLGRWWPSYRPEHLSYFDRRTLRSLIERGGLSTISVSGDSPLFVPLPRIVERLHHYFGLPAVLSSLVPRLSIPIWLGDLELIARKERRGAAEEGAGPGGGA